MSPHFTHSTTLLKYILVRCHIVFRTCTKNQELSTKQLAYLYSLLNPVCRYSRRHKLVMNACDWCHLRCMLLLFVYSEIIKCILERHLCFSAATKFINFVHALKYLTAAFQQPHHLHSSIYPLNKTVVGAHEQTFQTPNFIIWSLPLQSAIPLYNVLQQPCEMLLCLETCQYHENFTFFIILHCWGSRHSLMVYHTM